MSRKLTRYPQMSVRDSIKTSTTTAQIQRHVEISHSIFLRGEMKEDTYNKIVELAMERNNELLNAN